MISTNSNVETQNGRIVYNRSYQNIPKGSYSGETYTVKRGDTLFYIARITGNDFRDLAQRNNVPAPYGLNVGQTLQIGNGSGQPITGGNPITVADATQGGVPAAPQIKSPAVAQQPVITYSDDSGNSGGSKMLPSNGANVATTTAPVVTAPQRLAVQPTVQRRSEAGAGRLTGRSSITSLPPKVAIKVSISPGRADNLWSPLLQDEWFTQVTHSGVTVI